MAGLSTKKSLGQHFLVDMNVVRAIVAAVPAQPTTIVEIGPGEGALLEPLLRLDRQVIAVEKDRRLVERWQNAGHAKLRVIEADAVEPGWLDELPAGDLGLVGNLPYNVATPILRLLLAHHERFPWLVLMFQKEVADRIRAGGSRQGGPMGVLAQLAYHVEAVCDVPPGAFRPPPRVQSAVIRLRRLAEPWPAAHMDAAWRLLLVLYQRRRARLDRAVAQAGGVDRTTAQAWMHGAGLRADARPDHMSAAAFRQLAGHLLRREAEA